jgi:hypothetical protein
MTGSEEINGSGRRSVFATHPTWIGRVLRGTLPEAAEPLALYYSWEYDARSIPALLVLSTALVGVHMEVVGRAGVLSVTRSSVRLDEVARVSTTMRTAIVGSGAEPVLTDTQAVEIELRRELPPLQVAHPAANLAERLQGKLGRVEDGCQVRGRRPDIPQQRSWGPRLTASSTRRMRSCQARIFDPCERSRGASW